MDFFVSAPGVLEERTGTGGEPLTGCQDNPPPDPRFIGKWQVSASNYGVSQAQVASWVDSALGGSQGWSRAGITFVQADNAPVTFQVVQTISGPADAIGVTSSAGSGTPLVQLELAAQLGEEFPTCGPIQNVNHEAGHAFFGADHVTDTSDSIMVDSVLVYTADWPSNYDITAVRNWLGI